MHSEKSLLSETATLKNAIDQADAIIIGAGSGLSTAAGLRYDDAEFFTAALPATSPPPHSRPFR
ncbi:hypothetical protein AGMMS49928_08410 [Spirochaetia bacterium]|nr:hypothetical protein AGMMS49928_08410 [Spirochaetia bacterium]